jgi:hypothetical protein
VITDKFDFQTRGIPLSRIDWTDGTYRLTYGRPIRDLRLSIKTIGLRQLPVLQEKEKNHFCIVAGYRRLQALQNINQEQVPCKIALSDTKEKDLLLFNFHENIDRGFNSVEKSLVVKKLSAFLEEKDLILNYLPLLNLPPQKETIERCLRISEISPIYLPALVQGRLFPETVEVVVKDFFPLSHLVFSLFIFFHWGFQKQKEFLSNLKEICIRRLEEPEKFLISMPIGELLHRSQWTPQQKGEALRKYFRTCLFPVLTETEKRFEEMILSLNLNQGTRIYPPPSFEGGEYGLDIRFSSPKGLKTSLEKINLILEDGKLDQLP